MGYFGQTDWRSKADVRNSILEDCNSSDGPTSNRVLKDSMVGNHLWVALEHVTTKDEQTVTTRYITLFLINKMKDGSFMYKPIDEFMEPYFYDCPAALIKLAGPTASPSALRWRAKCADVLAEKANQKNLVKQLAIGNTFTMKSIKGVYQVISLTPRRYCNRVDVRDGLSYTFSLARVNAIIQPQP